MPRRNRVDPWGDLVADPGRGLFTGNRGCLVDADGRVVRHHAGRAWITCRLRFKDWRVGLARPGRWTPLFFLDDAVALAAGHRPCSTCRREDHVAYREAVAAGDVEDGVEDSVEDGADTGMRLRATEIDRRLADERLRPGRGLDRATDRRLRPGRLDELPAGTVVLGEGRRPSLWTGSALQPFDFSGWGSPRPPAHPRVEVLTPPTSVSALAHGFVPHLHATADT
ncbi:hypothetical protein ACOCJ5_10660 [Knoellia sp. CPCC 206450]|uniref:hypothetical protein n=1 Tax=Knoellia tibetensis TaxID=3404798 RepID=UPI003B42C559